MIDLEKRQSIFRFLRRKSNSLIEQKSVSQFSRKKYAINFTKSWRFKKKMKKSHFVGQMIEFEKKWNDRLDKN